MSGRLSILFAQDHSPYPCFTTSELSDVLRISKKKIKDRAKNEGWQSFDMKELGLDDAIDSYPVWDALSMPEETRQQIAAGHYKEEELECPLLTEAEAEARQIQFYFPDTDFQVVRAALYRTRQFSMIKDIAISLQLPVYDALDAVSSVYGMNTAILSHLGSLFLTGEFGPFLLLKEEIRLFLLIQHFSRYTDDFLPEFLPKESEARQ